MIKIIKMDLYRLFKSASTYIMLVVITGLCCFFSYMQLSMEEDYHPSVFGIFTDMGFLQLVPTIVVSLYLISFTVGEYTDGFIKNIGGQIKNRSLLVNSKFVTAIVFDAIGMLATIFGTLLMLVIKEHSFKIWASSAELKMVALEFLWIIMVTYIWVMLSLIFRSQAAPTTIASILLLMGELLDMGIDRVYNVITDKTTAISEYFPLGLFYKTDIISAENPEPMVVVVMALIYMVVTVVISNIIVKKRDLI